MLKRLALMVVASATVVIPASVAFAAPSPDADGVLPDGACHAAYPAYVQSALCGRGTGGPGGG